MFVLTVSIYQDPMAQYNSPDVDVPTARVKQCLISHSIHGLWSQPTSHGPSFHNMAQVSNDFKQTSLSSLSSPSNILDFVNERLLSKPTQQQRTSKLENYFKGYREFLEQPPSPTPSDEDDLFCYVEQSSKNLNARPRDLLQNPLRAESQGE